MSDQVPTPPAPLWSVKIFNDDLTPMEFVVHVLQQVFDLDRNAAMRLMLHAHHHGTAECAACPEAEAKARVADVLALAGKHRHPLQCMCEQKTYQV